MNENEEKVTAERHFRCPNCNARREMLVLQYDGSYLCQQCDSEFRVKPKISVKEGKEAPYLGEYIRGLIDLARPATMLPAGIAGFFLVWLGSILAGSSFSIPLALGVGILLGLLQGGGQILNQSSRFEAKLDCKNKPYRPIPQGKVSCSEGKLFGIAIITGAIGFSFAISLWFGVLATVIALFGVFYTYGPSLKYKFLANNFWQGFSRGSLPFLIPYVLFRVNSFVPLGMAVMGGILVSSIQSVKDVPDLEGDRKLSIPTFPVQLGIRGTKKAMTVIATFAFGALLGMILMGTFPLSFAVLFTLTIPVGWLIWSLGNPTRYKYIENSLNWGVMYGVIGALFICPPVLLALW